MGFSSMSSAHSAASPLDPARIFFVPAAHASAEYATFLLLCDALADFQDDERRLRVAAVISQPEAIAALIAMAERERVLPALHEAIAARHAHDVSKAYRAMLATEHEANRRRNAALRQALHELGEAGAAAGLQFAALKGAAWIVEDPADCAPWRTMIDLDVLVAPEQFEAVPALLTDMGYALASRSKRFKDNFHHAPYRHPRIPVTLEVHRHIGWRHRLLPTETVLAGARPLAPGILLPAAWTRAFHAMIHWQIQDHGRSRATLPLKELVEAARFLTRRDVDWATVRAHATEARTLEACAAAVIAASALLAAPVPTELAPDAAAQRWSARALARRASPLRTWIATQTWRAGTLWRCEKVGYRCALRGVNPSMIVVAVWGARLVRLPLLAVRAAGIAAGAVVRFAWPGRERLRRDPPAVR
jgi:hypothetical protein